MKKILMLICTILCANVLLAQARFTIGNITYQVCGPNKVLVIDANKSITSIKIPAKVTNSGVNYNVIAIRAEAFRHCTALNSVIIPNTIEHIGDEAFFACFSLQSVKIPNSVIKIDNSAFGCCKYLNSVIIGNGVTEIGNLAFSNCDLTNVVVGKNVTKIGWGAFGFTDKKIATIKFLSPTPPDTEESTLDPKEDKLIIYVPKGSKDAYTKSYWGKYKIEEMDNPAK